MPAARRKEPESPWNDGFLFLGNQLALDFLNTRPVQDGQPIELLPDFDALLRWFRAAGQLTVQGAEAIQRRWGKSSRAQRTLEELRSFRERLRAEVSRWEGGGTLARAMADELNRRMAQHPMRARLTAKSNETALDTYFETGQPEDLFAPLAHAAALLFSQADRTRVRKCRNCVLHFHDTSKKGTRQWCSMQLCGNRIKVAAYAARKRRAPLAEGQRPRESNRTR